MLGPTQARNNRLGHRFVAKTAEALGISGEDNRYKEYSWADAPQARWGGTPDKFTTSCMPPLYTFSAERRPLAVIWSLPLHHEVAWSTPRNQAAAMVYEKQRTNRPRQQRQPKHMRQ